MCLIGQGFAKRNTDLGCGVDSPAVGVQQGSQIAATEFEPSHDHSRSRDRQQQADKDDNHLPPGQAHKTFDEVGHGGGNHTESHTDGSEDTGKLSNVERRGSGCSSICIFGCR